MSHPSSSRSATQERVSSYLLPAHTIARSQTTCNTPSTISNQPHQSSNPKSRKTVPSLKKFIGTTSFVTFCQARDILWAFAFSKGYFFQHRGTKYLDSLYHLIGEAIALASLQTQSELFSFFITTITLAQLFR